MASHSRILAWRIPWTEDLAGLQSTGCKQSDMTERLSMHTGCEGWATLEWPIFLSVSAESVHSMQLLTPF